MAETGNESLQLVLEARTSREKSERAQALVARAFEAVDKTRKRQALSRAFLAGEVRPYYPSGVRDAFARTQDGSAVQYVSPQTMSVPLKLISTFTGQWPAMKRDETARGHEPERISTRIERLADGVMYDLWPYPRSCDLVLLDGEAAGTVVPSVAHWRAPADQYDYLTPDEWKQLPDDQRELWDWRPAEGSDGEGRYRRFGRKYRRDAKGRAPWDAAYLDDDGTSLESWFREDAEATKSAILEAIEDRVKSRVPLEMECHDFSTMAPLNPRFGGKRGILVDGLAVRETFDSVILYSRGLRWGQRSGPNAALVPADSMTKSAPVTLHTMWLTDGDGRPYLIRSVDGCETYQQGEGGEWSETIDLYKDHGIDFLPVAHTYGMHFAVRDADKRVVPYMAPLMGGLLLRDKLVTTTDFHTGQTAWGGWFVEIDPQVAAAMPELAKKPNFDVKSMTATPIPGRAVPAVHPGASQSVLVLKEMVDADLEQAGTNPAALGGEGATGMMDRAMIARDAKRGLAMVWSGIDMLYAQQASNACRVLACLARERGKPITLNLLTEQPGETPGQAPSATRSKVVVDGDMFGGDYTLRPERPPRWGDDPATQAMLMDAQDRKKATWTEMRSGVGDPSPWDSFADITIEDFFMNTPEGKAMIMEDAARINMDTDKLELLRLQGQGQVNGDGVPMGMAAGVGQAAMLQSEGGTAMPGVTLDVTAPGAMGSPGDALNGAAVNVGQGAGLVNRIARAGGDASGLDLGRAA